MEEIILIPTLNRLKVQSTYDSIPKIFKPQTFLVVSESEYKSHKKQNRKCIVCPFQGKGIARTRQWIIDYCHKHNHKKLMMIDDDLFPSKKVETKISRVYNDDAIEGIEWIFQTLDSFVHCSFSERSYNFRTELSHIDGCKNIQWTGYDIEKLCETDCSFTKNVPDWFFMEDYHMTIQLLRKGFVNRTSMIHRYNAKPFNNPGGVSNFRTKDKMEFVSKLLSKLHPDYVSVVQKFERTDVKINWRKLRNGK